MSPRGPLPYVWPGPKDPAPQGLAIREIVFRRPVVIPPSRIGLLIVAQFGRSLPVTVSGEYAPMLPNPWLYTGGDPIRGARIIAWATSPVVTEEELENA